jgi:hypothetical protein
VEATSLEAVQRSVADRIALHTKVIMMDEVIMVTLQDLRLDESFSK